MDLLSRPWPWYVAGPLIGVLVPVLLVLGNRQFGVSSTLRHACAALLPRGVPFFQYRWPQEGGWNLAFAAGIVVGGFLAGVVFRTPEPVAIAARTRADLAALGIHDLTGLAPRELFHWGTLSRRGARSSSSAAASSSGSARRTPAGAPRGTASRGWRISSCRRSSPPSASSRAGSSPRTCSCHCCSAGRSVSRVLTPAAPPAPSVAAPTVAAPTGPAASAADATPARAGLLTYGALGVGFGVLLVRAELVSWFRMQEMFRFQAFHMYGVFASALAVAVPAVALLRRLGVHTVDGTPVHVPRRSWAWGCGT
jgi:uncharacterized membrane protein YedE/YeeE